MRPWRARFRSLARSANRRVWPQHLLHGPEWVVLGVNNACNLRCRMCDVGTGEDGSNFHTHMTSTNPPVMPVALAERIVDQVARHYPSARLGFAFTEPTAWRPLVDVVRSASARGVRSAVTTNGLLLPKLAVPLAAAGLDELVVSIDGPAEIHDAIRGRDGSFERAIEGVRAALAAPRPPRVSIFAAITEWNIGHLARFAASLRDLPLERLGFMHTVFVAPEAAATHNATWGQRYPATPSNTRELRLDHYDLDELWSEIAVIRALSLPFPVSWSPAIDTRAELERYYRSPTPFGRRCADAFSALLVKSDGSVVPAHSRCYPVVVGDLWREELNAVWNGARLGAFRRDLASVGLFAGCSRCCSAR